MVKKESKKKSQIMLWVGISFISVAVITFLIFGFSTQWTFKPKSNKSNKSNKQIKSGNVEPLINDNNNRNIIYEYDFKIESQEEVSPEDESKITIPEKQEKHTDNFATSILKYHNEIRKKCGNTPELKWNNEIATYAQQWANQLKKDVDQNNNGTCSLGQKLIRHNPNVNSKKYGENIAYNAPDSGYDQNNRISINGWAAEGYHPNASGSVKDSNGTPVTGHYSAMNWTTLTDIGCGQSITKDGCAITVCNYQDRTDPGNPKAPNSLSARNANKSTDFANKIKCSEPLQLS